MSGIDIAALRRMVTAIAGNDPQGSFASRTGSEDRCGFARTRSFTLGLAGADAAFPHGLAGDALHEVFAENPGAHMAATGFALAFAARAAEHSTQDRRPIIWIEEEKAASEYGGLYPPGLHAFGIDPSRLLIVRCPTAQDVLKAANDALEAGSGGKASHLVSGVVASVTGQPKCLDLTASRRLLLATETAQLPVIPPFPPCWSATATAHADNGSWNGTMKPLNLVHENGTAERLFLALWFPFLPTDRLRRAVPHDGRERPPLVVTERTANALRLTAVDAAAARLGLFPGMALTDARARVERLEVAAAAPEQDAALLKRLAHWCERYTPLVAYDEPHGLMLDITGCAHLFGGLAAMRADAIGRIEHAGLKVQAAIADNSFAARLLARGTKGGVFSKAEADRQLPRLPQARGPETHRRCDGASARRAHRPLRH